MFDDPHKRTFFSAPQSVTSLIAAFLEPGITVLTFIAATLAFDERMDRPALTLCLLVFALTFPGRNRFRDSLHRRRGRHRLVVAGAAGDPRAVRLRDAQLQLLRERRAAHLGARSHRCCNGSRPGSGERSCEHHAARPSSRRTAVIVGASALGVKVARALQEGETQGVDFVGYFDDRSDGRIEAATKARVLGTLADVAAYTTEHGIREVYITLPLGSQPRIVALLEELQGTTASLFFVPDVFGISIIQGRLQDMNGVPVVGICETPFTGTNELVKRLSDVILASIIVVLISPLLVAIAIGIKLSSPGPVIFKQRRNGLDGDEIVVYKFRSMTTEDDGPVVRQATRNDPRITRFGAFLRRTSLDELPQFFNVLQGTMSIVGPRPHAVTHNAEYRQIIKAYMVRHKVKPGITGWAQVNGQRGETDTIEKMRTRVEYDLEYLRNWSLGLDLRIIVTTARLLFFDRHAY